MISYLTYSMLCMVLILLFYHAFLAREKIYQVNRWYLLGGLLFSMAVPFIPIVIVDYLMNPWNNSQLLFQQINYDVLYVGGSQPQTSNIEWFYPLIFALYSMVTLLISVRLVRILYQMRLQLRKRPITFFEGYKIVLLDDDVTPHTFWNTIFVNLEQYEEGKISEEVLSHELAHARQKHTLDILIVEFLKTIFWFNPILYFYKRAIQLNHELIADEKVLSKGVDIIEYQTLLLDMHSANNNCFLGTSLNFSITKRRFNMMIQQKSKYRSVLLAVAIIPFFLILAVTFGCKPNNEVWNNENGQTNELTLELVDGETIIINGKRASTSDFESRFSNLSLDPTNTVIHFKVNMNDNLNNSDNNTTKIQKIIREKGFMRINYYAIKSDNSITK